MPMPPPARLLLITLATLDTVYDLNGLNTVPDEAFLKIKVSMWVERLRLRVQIMEDSLQAKKSAIL
jgi:hypothetical protein